MYLVILIFFIWLTVSTTNQNSDNVKKELQHQQLYWTNSAYKAHIDTLAKAELKRLQAISQREQKQKEENQRKKKRNNKILLFLFIVYCCIQFHSILGFAIHS